MRHTSGRDHLVTFEMPRVGDRPHSESDEAEQPGDAEEPGDRRLEEDHQDHAGREAGDGEARTAPNAVGNAVQAITSTKTSHTWLASQTGLIECWIIPRTRPPRRAPPAVRSQNPAPKSALP